MKREVFNVHIGNKQMKSIVKLTSDPVNKDTDPIRFKMIQYGLLASLASQPDLTHCSLEPFTDLHIHYDGTCWTAEASAIVPDPNESS